MEKHTPPRKFDWDEAAERYKRGESTRVVAAAFGVSQRTIIRTLGILEVELRSSGGKGLARIGGRSFDWEEAAKVYQESPEKSTVEIAAQFGVTSKGLIYALTKLGIPRRPPRRISRKTELISPGHFTLPPRLASLVNQEASRRDLARGQYLTRVLDEYFEEQGIKLKKDSRSKGWDRGNSSE